MVNDLIGHNLNFDLQFDIYQDIVTVDYVDYLKTDSIHPSPITYHIMRNLFLEDEKKLIFVEIEYYE